MVSAVNYSNSLFLANYINSTNEQVANSLQKLSSGLRVRRPSDDPGAYFVASTLERRASDTTSIAREMEDDISGLKTALDALNEIKDILDEMKDVAYEASQTSDSETAKRATLGVDYDNLVDQINTIYNNFSFNGVNLLKEDPADTIDPDYPDDANGIQGYWLSIDENPSDKYYYYLWETELSSGNGLNLGTGNGTDGYTFSSATNAVDNTKSFAGSPAIADGTEQTNATAYYNAIVGTRDTDKTSGLVRIDRNISRVSATLTLLEGRRNTLMNKAANYEAAREALVGVDKAAEATTLSSAQILQQAGAYFLAQANSNNSTVAKLIYGLSS